MYNVSVGPSKIVAKTRRGISQNLESFQNFSRKPIDFDNGEVMNGPRPVFHTSSKKCSNSKQQDTISPQHEELIKFVSESWSKIFKEYESDGPDESENISTSNSSTIMYYQDPEPNAFLQNDISENMSSSVSVTVFGRVKPRQKNVKCQSYRIKYGDHQDQISFPSLKEPEEHEYGFNKIYGERATQEQVFEGVAKPIIKKVFEGYNGTIFTYGQTGSGKTYTMNGSPTDWSYVGLIPRAIEKIFQMKDSDTVISITYFEIYNEHVYDLIRTDPVDPDFLQDIQIYPLNSFRNVSVHIVKTAYEALELYKRGDANKMMTETSSNVRSSRSHVIFSLALEFSHPRQEMKSLKPVLYLIDLAGSEKITKCGNPRGETKLETRCINLSLHYLEQVLVALRQPKRSHIPYRNSLLTALLSNSLGGNCITAMIATFSLFVKDMEETIYTCRFAQRIALVKNKVKLRELPSPQKEIDSLKRENKLLKHQLKLFSTAQIKDDLTDQEKESCTEMVRNFLRDEDFFALPLTDVRRMEFCFHLMRSEIRKKKPRKPKKPETRVNSEKECDIELLTSILSEESIYSEEINPGTTGNPVDCAKVNITHKTSKSTDELSGISPEKTNRRGNVGGEPSDPITSSLIEDEAKITDYSLHQDDYEIAENSRSPNFCLKLKGDSAEKLAEATAIEKLGCSSAFERTDPHNSNEKQPKVNSKSSVLNEVSFKYAELQIDLEIDLNAAYKKSDQIQ